MLPLRDRVVPHHRPTSSQTDSTSPLLASNAMQQPQSSYGALVQYAAPAVSSFEPALVALLRQLQWCMLHRRLSWSTSLQRQRWATPRQRPEHAAPAPVANTSLLQSCIWQQRSVRFSDVLRDHGSVSAAAPSQPFA